MHSFLSSKHTRTIIGIVIFTAVAALVVKHLMPKEYAQNPDPNHIHVDFAVYVQDMKIDFTDDKYMSGVPDAATGDNGEYLHQYLHLHDNIGYVIHSHKPDYTLADFFESIGFKMGSQCLQLDSGVNICPDGTKRWYMLHRETPLYGTSWEEVEWNPDYVFNDMDQILLTYQSNSASSKARIEAQLEDMTEAACLYSKTCPWKGDPPEENCIADPEVPCVVPLGD